MEIFLPWLRDQWFSLIQTIGIVSSLILTGISLRRDRRSRRVGDYLTLAEHHRDLWAELHRRPDLARVPSEQVDLVAQPLTPQEEEFLLLVVTHFHTGWLLSREGSLLDLDVLARDAGVFFRLPLPADVWDRTRDIRDPQFVRFVEEAARKRGKRPRLIKRRLRRWGLSRTEK